MYGEHYQIKDSTNFKKLRKRTYAVTPKKFYTSEFFNKWTEFITGVP